jgi:hypothetical protein
MTPNLEQEYIHRLKQLGNNINVLRGEIVKSIESANRSFVLNREIRAKMTDIVKQCIKQSNDFIELMNEMVANSKVVQANNSSKTVILHMIRESQYFVGIEQLVLQ